MSIITRWCATAIIAFSIYDFTPALTADEACGVLRGTSQAEWPKTDFATCALDICGELLLVS